MSYQGKQNPHALFQLRNWKPLTHFSYVISYRSRIKQFETKKRFQHEKRAILAASQFVGKVILAVTTDQSWSRPSLTEYGRPVFEGRRPTHSERGSQD